MASNPRGRAGKLQTQETITQHLSMTTVVVEEDVFNVIIYTEYESFYIYTYNYPYIDSTTVLSEIYIYIYIYTPVQVHADKISHLFLCVICTAPMPSMQNAAVGLCMYSSTVGHIHMCTYIYLCLVYTPRAFILFV